MGVVSALEELRLADHMLYVTMPLLDDKRVFINAVTHVSNAVKGVIHKFMTREADFKRIRMPSEELLINDFLTKYVNKLGLESYTEMIKGITCFNDVRSKSSIKLKKNDKFIVISPEYSMVALSLDQARFYVRQAREFVSRLEAINQ